MERDIETAESIARRWPAWASADISVTPLAGGITNRNFVVTATDGQYVIRLPGKQTELLGIDREREVAASLRAAELGIGPPILGELPGIRTLISKRVDGVHLDADGFIDRLDQVVPLLRALHRSGPLQGDFPIHRVVEWHARDAASHGTPPPLAYTRLLPRSLQIEAAFRTAPDSPVPCHNDLLPGNVLFSTDRVWLLDYEYAGMNDAFFDLANLSVNCGLTTEADHHLLTLYFGSSTPSRWARLQLMKIMSEFREGMWAVVQQAISTLDEDFVAYADERLGNCERLANSADFDGWIHDAQSPDAQQGAVLKGSPPVRTWN